MRRRSGLYVPDSADRFVRDPEKLHLLDAARRLGVRSAGADFPYPASGHLPIITSMSRECGLSVACKQPFVSPPNIPSAGTAWPINNLGFVTPLRIWTPYTVRTVFWVNAATVAGNADVGVYTTDGALLFNAGSTGVAGASVPQKVALGSPFVLWPGEYYMELVCSSTGNHPWAASPTLQGLEAGGCAQVANGALPLAAVLPALASPSSFGGVLGPIFGISNRVSTLI